MWDFIIYMVLMTSFIIIVPIYAFFMYVAFDVRKRFMGEPYEPGLNLTMQKLKEEYRIANEWWRNR